MRTVLQNSAVAYAVVFPLIGVLVAYQTVQVIPPRGRHRRRHRRRWPALIAVSLSILFAAVVLARFVVLG